MDEKIILWELDKKDSQIVEGDYGYIQYGTGLSMEIPEGYVGLTFPRSSISETGLIKANSVGVIDSGYRGEVSVVFRVANYDADKYTVGDRIAQIMIIPIPSIEFEEVDELPESDRGEGGFGSSN